MASWAGDIRFCVLGCSDKIRLDLGVVNANVDDSITVEELWTSALQRLSHNSDTVRYKGLSFQDHQG